MTYLQCKCAHSRAEEKEESVNVGRVRVVNNPPARPPPRDW